MNTEITDRTLLVFVGQHLCEWQGFIADWVEVMGFDPDRVAIAEEPTEAMQRVAVIVACGVDAYTELTGIDNVQTRDVRGKWANWRGVPLMTVAHPSYVRRAKNIVAVTMMMADDLREIVSYITRDTRLARLPFRSAALAPLGPQVGPTHPDVYRESLRREQPKP